MPEGYAGCVLLRAMEPVFGLPAMARARGLELTAMPRPAQLRLIASGPGRMSQALSITRLRDNDKDLTGAGSDLWFADDGYRPERITATPRVGISKARSMLLRVQFIRIAMGHLRARCALAAAMGTSAPAPLLRSAEAGARALQREGTAWSGAGSLDPGRPAGEARRPIRSHRSPGRGRGRLPLGRHGPLRRVGQAPPRPAFGRV